MAAFGVLCGGKKKKKKGVIDLNRDLKALMALRGIQQWRVAKAVGMNEAAFSRLLRGEIASERKIQILEAIEKLAGGAANG